MQEVFLHVIEKNPVFNDKNHEKAWILRTTINVCKNKLNTFWNRNKQSIDDSPDVAVLLGTIGEKEAMRQMPERISFAGDYVVIDKTYLTEFADKADAKKKAEEETLEIPEGVETVPDEMFRNFNMKEVKLPSTIKTIGANAFYNCKKLMKINFPASLKEIGKDAFCWTEIGDCISKEWQAKKDTFYTSFTEYEKKQKEEQAKHRNAKSIDCTGEAFDAVSGTYSYDSSMQNQFITLTMKESGIFYYYASEEVKLYDADKKEVNNCKQVKKGDVLYLKTPEKITGTFKINNAIICPELTALKLGEDINENYFMANGTVQYLPFTKKTNGGVIVRIVDLNLVTAPNMKIEVQKKNGSKWTSVSKQISISIRFFLASFKIIAANTNVTKTVTTNATLIFTLKHAIKTASIAKVAIKSAVRHFPSTFNIPCL